LEGFIDFFRVKEFPFDEDFAQLLLLFSHGDASSVGVGLLGVRSVLRDPHSIVRRRKLLVARFSLCRSLWAVETISRPGKRPVGRSGDNRLRRGCCAARYLVRGRSLTPGRT